MATKRKTFPEIPAKDYYLTLPNRVICKTESKECGKCGVLLFENIVVTTNEKETVPKALFVDKEFDYCADNLDAHERELEQEYDATDPKPWCYKQKTIRLVNEECIETYKHGYCASCYRNLTV